MSYFRNLGVVWYTLNNGDQVMMNDITKFAAFDSRWKTDKTRQLQYTIIDGELPHMISNRLYGTVNYWWTILLFNNIHNFNEQWPRSPDQVDRYIAEKYPTKIPSDVHHYITSDGLVADLLSTRIEYGVTTDIDAINDANLESVSIYEYEHALNDLKRNIFLIDPDMIGTVQNEFELLMGA